jgi:hypothetical protein
MPEGDDLNQLVTATATRLRLVSADFADAAADVRARNLSDEVERALAKVHPGQRRNFLQALTDKFPSWDGELRVTPTQSAAQSPTDQRELSDPTFLVTRLCALASKIPAEGRKAIAERLREAGVIPQAATLPWSDDLVAGLTTKLQLGGQRKIDPARVFELATLLVEFSLGLHQLVGTAWRTLAPSTDNKHRPGSLQNVMGKFIAGDPQVNRTQVATEVDRMRQLIASVLAAVGEAGRQIARGQVERFSPAEIRNAAAREKTMLTSIEATCWKKYLQLWDSMDEAAIEKEIRDTIAKYAESLLRLGASR